MSVVRSREVVRISEVRNTLYRCMLKSIGAFQFVRSTEVVRISEGPLTWLREVHL